MKIKSFIAHSVAKLVMIAAKEAEVLKAYFSNVKDIEKLDKQ